MIVKGGRESQKWLQEYSGYNLQEIHESLLFKSATHYEDSLSHQEPILSGSQISSVTTGMSAMNQRLEMHSDLLSGLANLDFDCFRYCEAIGRDHTFITVIYKIMNDLPHNCPSYVPLNNDKLIGFLGQIYAGYRQDVAYHNDLHGADVT